MSKFKFVCGCDVGNDTVCVSYDGILFLGVKLCRYCFVGRNVCLGLANIKRRILIKDLLFNSNDIDFLRLCTTQQICVLTRWRSLQLVVNMINDRQYAARCCFFNSYFHLVQLSGFKTNSDFQIGDSIKKQFFKFKSKSKMNVQVLFFF